MASKKKTVKSSPAEYLTFVASGGESDTAVEIRYEEENIWLTQKLMAELYGVTVPAINQHLKLLEADSEIEPQAAIKKFLTTASDGKNYQTNHYNLQTIISVGFKVENERAVQFRKWARQIVKDHTIQGWTMDGERLKAGGNLTDEFFERQLAEIREIRLSKRKFYQKVTDIYATSIDYDSTAASTKRFFAAVQNKMHYAIHGNTTAELIVNRWFVDFNFPDENGHPHKDNGGKMISSELGEIPEGWEVSHMNEYVSISGGGTPSTKEESFWNGGVPWTSPKDLSERPFPFLTRTNKTLTKKGLADSSGWGLV